MLSLEDREWQGFLIEDICDIYPGVRLIKADMKQGPTPFIGASDKNNGITGFVSNTNSSYKANVLGVNYNGSVVESFYHPYGAIFSDDVKQFTIKNVNATKYMFLFLKTALLQQQAKYAYGYKFNEQRMRRQIILLPAIEDAPDWEFMDAYIKEREESLIERYSEFIQSELATLRERE